MNLSAPISSSSIDRDNPWPGLATFTEEQAGQFHGRDTEIRDLTKRTERNALTVLFGQSGLGKSSLLQAGVFPRLRANNYWPIYLRLDHGPGAPTPTEQIKAVVQADTVRTGTWTKSGCARPGETLWEYFHHRDDRLVSANGRTIVPVLVFDQFEELFTLGEGGGAERTRAVTFMSELAELVENRPSEQLVARLEESSADMELFDFSRTDYRVVITLREDYLPHLESLKTTMPALMENRLRLARMTGKQALEAVVKPGGSLVTEDVARAIVEFVAGARGGSVERLAELDVEPPLLSVICRELNERRRSLGQAQITADLVSGNRREILTNFYERCVADLPEGMRTFVEDRLLTKSGFRDNLALESALEEPGVTPPLIDTLVSRRLLRLEDRAGIKRVELTHDVLADVVRASRDARQQRHAVEEAAKKDRLALETASRQARRQRFAIAGLATLVVALGIGAVFAVRAQRHATDQAARVDLATGSRLLDEGNVGDGLAHLVNAARRDPHSDVAATRILTALASHTFSLPVGAALKLPGAVDEIRFLAGGRSALAKGDDGRIRLIDVVEWKVVREYQFDAKVHPTGLRIADKNPDLFAVALMNGTLVVCDTATGKPRCAPIVPPARQEELARQQREQKRPWRPDFSLSPDGRWLRTLNTSWSLFDTATGAERAFSDQYHTTTHDNNPVQTAFSPDSSRFVTHGARFRSIASPSRGGFSSDEHRLELRTVSDGTVVTTLPLSLGTGQGVAFSADGKRLLVLRYVGGRTQTRDPAVFVHDAETLAPIGPAIPRSLQRDDQVWLTPDGTRVIMTTNDRSTHVYDATTGKALFPALLHGGPARCIGISDDSRILATVSVDGYCRLWDLQTGALAAESTFRQDRSSPAVLSPDGRTLLVTTPSGLVYRLQLTRGPAAPLVLPRQPGEPSLVKFAAQPPGRLYWFGTQRAKVLEITSGRWMADAFPLPKQSVNEVGGRHYISGGAALQPGVPVIWLSGSFRARNGIWIMGQNAVAREVAFTEPILVSTSSVISENGKLLLAPGGAGEENNRGIWSLHTGVRVGKSPPWRYVRLRAAFSPDDRLLAYEETETDDFPGGIAILEIGASKIRLTIPADGRAPFTAQRFSPDSSRLITGNSWGNVQRWDAATGKLLRSNQAHTYYVTRFEDSPDGRLYASMARDGSVQVWDSTTDEPVGGPLKHTGAVLRAAFSADNARLSTAGANGSGRVWDVRSGIPLTGGASVAADTSAEGIFSPGEQFVMTGTERDSTASRLWAAPPSGRGRVTPKWLLQLATLCAGRRLNEEGKIVSAVNEFDQLEGLRREIAALPAGDAYAEWARWFLSDRPDRPIAPGFTVTPADAKKIADELSAPDPLVEMTARADKLLGEEKFAELETLERKMLAWIIERDGEGRQGQGTQLLRLAATLMRLGRFAEAETQARTSLAIREKIDASERQEQLAASARGAVASALVGQKRYAEAEPLLLSALEAMKKLEDASGLTAFEARSKQDHVNSLIELYEATGRPEMAAEWKRWQPKTPVPDRNPRRRAAPPATAPKQ